METPESNQNPPNQDGSNTNASPPPLNAVKPGDSDAQESAAQQLAKVEKEMSSFERSTLRWAKTAVLMSGTAALFVCLQWWEMHTGSTDTHNLAVASGKEADRMKDFSDRMKDQSDRTKDLADHMKEQADQTKILAIAAGKQADAAKALADVMAKQLAANKELIESQGASVSVSFGRVINPISFHEGAPSIVFSILIQNTGSIKATHVAVRFKPYYSLMGNNIFTEPLQRQRDSCAVPTPPAQEWSWQDGKRVDLKGLRDWTVTVDPHATFERQLNFGMPKPTDAEIIKWPPSDVIQRNPTLAVTDRVFPVVVGCIDYQSGAMPEKHQTGFIFLVQEVYSDPTNSTAAPTLVHYGVDLPPEKVVIEQFFFGQGKKY